MSTRHLKQLLRRLAGATLISIVCLGHAVAAPGLTAANFVDVADQVSRVIDTSGLAFSTVVLGSAAARASAERVVFSPPRPAGPARFHTRCPSGGGVTIDVLDADAGGELSVGDRFKLDFASCGVSGGIVDGRGEFTVAGHRYEGATEFTELDFRFDRLGNSDMRWTGTARASLRRDLLRGTESYVVAYRDLAVTQGLHTMRWRFSVETVRPPIGEQLSRVAGAMTVDGLALQLRQDEPFVIGVEGHPRSGALTASDPGGARLEIEARRHRYAYRLFNPGNPGMAADSASESPPYRGR
jgi:hypothetical protein